MGIELKRNLLRGGLYGALIVSLIAGLWVHVYLHPKIHFFWEVFPFFYALYGFIGCIIIILGSKALGHFWLHRKEDYYENREQMRSKNQ